ncbi:unnamed protein product [Zymoseptoria tritici ST99CH_1E4]|uniref:Uncharacterized protein n=1 Tax=Zymoseptoria tritici ST99CH_1E4 TaxID=1276532 RepID=A0A2H1GNX6_ZYMTR|nr:unnamed protein product [Zymoseptoria tritici ST99CH_1E4]
MSNDSNKPQAEDADDLAGQRFNAAFPGEDMSAGSRLFNYLVVDEYDPADPRFRTEERDTAKSARSVAVPHPPSSTSSTKEQAKPLAQKECSQKPKADDTNAHAGASILEVYQAPSNTSFALLLLLLLQTTINIDLRDGSVEDGTHSLHIIVSIRLTRDTIHTTDFGVSTRRRAWTSHTPDRKLASALSSTVPNLEIDSPASSAFPFHITSRSTAHRIRQHAHELLFDDSFQPRSRFFNVLNHSILSRKQNTRSAHTRTRTSASPIRLFHSPRPILQHLEPFDSSSQADHWLSAYFNTHISFSSLTSPAFEIDSSTLPILRLNMVSPNEKIGQAARAPVKRTIDTSQEEAVLNTLAQSDDDSDEVGLTEDEVRAAGILFGAIDAVDTDSEAEDGNDGGQTDPTAATTANPSVPLPPAPPLASTLAPSAVTPSIPPGSTLPGAPLPAPNDLLVASYEALMAPSPRSRGLVTHARPSREASGPEWSDAESLLLLKAYRDNPAGSHLKVAALHNAMVWPHVATPRRSFTSTSQQVGAFIKVPNTTAGAAPTRDKTRLPGQIAALEAKLNSLPPPPNTPSRFLPSPRKGSKKAQLPASEPDAPTASPKKREGGKREERKKEKGKKGKQPALEPDAPTVSPPKKEESPSGDDGIGGGGGGYDLGAVARFQAAHKAKLAAAAKKDNEEQEKKNKGKE